MTAERRSSVILEEAKLSTQRNVTFFLLILLAGVTIAVFMGTDQSERSTQQQTIINLAMLAVGFWLGSSKSSADKDASMARIAEASAPVAAAAVAAAALPGKTDIKTDEVKIAAEHATVNEAPQPPKDTP